MTTLTRSAGFWVMATTALSVAGCVVTPALTPKQQMTQCQRGDWTQIGKDDGAAGRSGAYFGHHVQQCQPIAPLSDTVRRTWEMGRQAGLRTFCTELNAYRRGREGFGWLAVCPSHDFDIDIAKLEQAYDQGRGHYLQEQHRQRLISPIAPWYAHPYGYGPYGRRHLVW